SPGLHRLVTLTIEPIRTAELVVRLDQIWTEGNGLLQERLRVLEHVTFEIDEPQIEVSIQRRLLVVPETNRSRQMLDRLAEDLLLQTNVADVHAGERVLRLTDEHPLKVEQRVVEL